MKPIFSAVDDAWKKEFSSNYSLSLLISNDSLHYCILDTLKNKYLYIGVFSFEQVHSVSDLCSRVKEVFDQNEIFSLNYQSVRAAVSYNKSTLVPDEFFDEKETHAYIGFNHTVDPSERVCADNIPLLKGKNIYAISGELVVLLNEQFADIHIHHSASPLLEALLKENRFFNETRIFAHVQQKRMELIVLEKGKLVFYNSFDYQSPEDFIYFVLFICEQLSLDPDQVNFYFIGEIEKKSALYDIAYKYIRNVNFGRRPYAYNYSYKFAFFPLHFYFNVFSIGLPKN